MLKIIFDINSKNSIKAKLILELYSIPIYIQVLSDEMIGINDMKNDHPINKWQT